MMKPAACCRALAACFFLLTALVAGCSPDDSDLSEEEQGTLQVPLTTTGEDGSLYELSATLTLTGPAGTTTYDLGGSDTFEARVPPGQYSVELSSFVVSEDGVALSDAVLASPNPQSADIRPRRPETVVFRFVRGGGLVVDFSVDEKAFWFAGEFTIDEDWDAGPEDPAEATGLFAPYAGVTISYFILFDNLTSTGRYNAYDTGKWHTYVAEGAHLSFEGDPHGLFTGDIAPDLDGNELSVIAMRNSETGETSARWSLGGNLLDGHSFMLCRGEAELPVDDAGFADIVPFTSGQTLPLCMVSHTADGGTYSSGSGLASFFEFDWLAPL